MTKVGKVLGTVSWLFVGYLGISWLDVVLHNLDDEPMYQAWNIFALLFLQQSEQQKKGDEINDKLFNTIYLFINCECGVLH